MAFDAVHSSPHEPHELGSVRRFVSQPSAALLLQLAHPGLHVRPHVLAEHTPYAFCGDGQSPDVVQ